MKFTMHSIVFFTWAAIAALVISPAQAAAGGSNTEPQPAVSTEQSVVGWEAARKHPRIGISRLSEQQLQAAQRAPVPVLLPDRDALVRSALITTGPGWYAASMAEGQATVAISGNSKVIRIPNIPEPPALGDPALKPGAGEGRQEVSFKAFGIYYDLSVECFDHQNDARCADGQYVTQLLKSLKLALIDKK